MLPPAALCGCKSVEDCGSCRNAGAGHGLRRERSGEFYRCSDYRLSGLSKLGGKRSAGRRTLSNVPGKRRCCSAQLYAANGGRGVGVVLFVLNEGEKRNGKRGGNERARRGRVA